MMMTMITKTVMSVPTMNIITTMTMSVTVTITMGLLPDAYNFGLLMLRECRERFPCHRLQKKPLVSDPGMHHGTCITHVPWCMSGSLTRGGGGNVPSIPGACATRNFTYLARDPWPQRWWRSRPAITTMGMILITIPMTMTMTMTMTMRMTTKVTMAGWQDQ